MFKKYLALALVLSLIVVAYLFTEVWRGYQLLTTPEKQWTFMVYMAADNDIDLGVFGGSYGIKAFKDFNEMETVGSTSDVAVVVQIDGLNSSGRRYLVAKDNDENTMGSPMLQDLGEVNMGDPATLVDFVMWATTNFPAPNYCVILWDHGLGFQGVCKDWNGVSLPPEPIENLTIAELESALSTIANEVGKPIDLIGFDACLMQMIEVAYQIRNYSAVMVGSEETIPEDGWPYRYVLQNLTNNPNMEAAELARKIVETYKDYYINHTVIRDNVLLVPTTRLTLSAINLSQVDALTIALNNLSSSLIANYSVFRDELMTCRNLTQEFKTGELQWCYVDLYNFTSLIYFNDNITNPDVKINARNLLEVINRTVILEWHDSGRYEHLRYLPRGRKVTWHPGCPGSYGLSIYFPKNAHQYYSSYDQLDISTKSHFYWNDFLKVYLEIENFT